MDLGLLYTQRIFRVILLIPIVDESFFFLLIFVNIKKHSRLKKPTSEFLQHILNLDIITSTYIMAVALRHFPLILKCSVHFGKDTVSLNINHAFAQTLLIINENDNK